MKDLNLPEFKAQACVSQKSMTRTVNTLTLVFPGGTRLRVYI